MKTRPDGSLIFRSERNAIALLITSPTELNHKWTASRDADLQQAVDAELEKLPFSEEAKRVARTAIIDGLAGERPNFARIAHLLRIFVWSGAMEPHPGPELSTLIVEKLIDLPDE